MKQDMRTYKLFIFDFDGTLGDTKECVIASFQKAFVQNNLPKAPREHIIHTMGLSLPISFRQLTNNLLTDDMYDKLVSDYRAAYHVFLTQKTQLFPEVKETLQKLKKKGIILSIATSKKTELVKRNCEYLSIESYFDLFIGDDMVIKKKPDPEMLHQTLKKLTVPIAQAVMIGDSTYDIEMGNAIGMDTIAVTWGAHTKELLLTTKPTYIIDTFHELLRFA